MAPTVSDSLPRSSLIVDFKAVAVDKGVVVEAVTVAVVVAVLIPVPMVPAVVVVLVAVVVVVALGVEVNERSKVDSCEISFCHLLMVVVNPSISFSTLRTVPCK